MSLATIRNPVLRDLGLDINSSLVNDVKERILDYINESIEELNILAKWDILKDQGTVTLVTDQNLYALSSDVDVNRVIGDRFFIDSEDSFIYLARSNQYFQEQVIRGNTGLPTIWIPFVTTHLSKPKLNLILFHQVVKTVWLFPIGIPES